MFLEYQSEKNIRNYENMLRIIGSLSNLFSESDCPYLAYRVVENIFCTTLDAINLSRSDCSVDAIKDGIGIGIKTFLNNSGRSLQKIAEFNKDSELYRGKEPKEIIHIVAKLRNERIQFTKRIHSINEMIYHCVVRSPGKIMVYECSMDEIDISSIKNIKVNNNTISFEDNKNEYNFNISKSTLYKRFYTKNIFLDIHVDIMDDPYIFLKDSIAVKESEITYKLNNKTKKQKSFVYLPLFSDRGGRHVPYRSGLNQWNAKGRPRNPNEIYIPIPALIHKKFPNFFPSRDKSFKLMLPDGGLLNAKVCQEGRKALMSNPNSALGKWLLRQVMNLKEGKILTYERLKELGIDSVILYKEDDDTYTINFTELGSYDEFIAQYIE